MTWSYDSELGSGGRDCRAGRPLRWVPGVALALPVLFMCLPASAQSLRAATEDAVVETLASFGEARVIVILEDPVSTALAPGLRPSLAAVAATQDQVLSLVPEDEFVVTRRLDAAPVLAGVVNEEGLRKLQGMPEVKLIGIDELGSGPSRNGT